MQVAVVAKDTLYGSGLLSLILQTGLQTAGGARSVAEATKRLHGTGVIVVVSDGLEAEDWINLGQIKAAGAVKVLLIQTSDDDAAGKSAADKTVPSRTGAEPLLAAVRSLMGQTTAGTGGNVVREAKVLYGKRGRGLTKRELEVAHQICLGLSNRRISELLNLREQSVKNLVSSIMRKLDCENRVQIALKLTGKPFGSA